MATYKIMRYFEDRKFRATQIRERLTLEEAQKHCRDPETSWHTAKGAAAKATTKRCGAWCDGYTIDG